MKIKEAVNQKAKGLYFSNRILLPFHAHFLKIVIDDESYTDYSPYSKQICISEESDFTNVYFREFKNIKDAVSKYEAIKIVAVEKDEDVFNLKNHFKLVLYPENEHNIRIEFTDDDILLIE